MIDNPRTAQPYLGSRAFAADEDRSLFYGRDEEISLLTALVVAHQAVLLFGQSGSGKSSLIHAGLIPVLQEQGYFTVLPTARVSGVLFPRFEAGQIENIYVSNLLAGLAETTRVGFEQLQNVSLSAGLEPYLDIGYEGPGSGDGSMETVSMPRLLILDQSEEIFTSYLERWVDREDFFRQLGECLVKHPRLGLLISIREEYLAQLEPYTSYFPDRLRHRFRLDRLGVEKALAAVTGPARAAGVIFAPGVAEAIVDNLRRIQPSLSKNAALGPYIEPVQLQIVCHRLWEKLPSDRKTIEMADVEEFGNIDQALVDYYESTVAAVVSQTDVSERQVRSWFSEHLITSSGTRALVFRDATKTAGLPNRVVDILTDTYLVRAEHRGGATWYELAHDRLVAPIQEDNRRWMENNRNPLRDAATAWHASGRNPTRLLSGSRLEDAQTLLADTPDEFTALEQEYLAISETAHYARIVRRQRRLLVVACGVIIMLALLAAWSWIRL